MKAAAVEDCSSASSVISSQVLAYSTELAFRIGRRIREARNGQTTQYEIAELAVGFRFLDDRIKEQVSPAFHHLRTEKNIQPELTVLLDGASSPLADLSRLPDWNGLGQTDVLAVKVGETMLIVQCNGLVVGALDYLSKAGYWVDLHPLGVSYLERTAPMLHLLSLWFGSRGKYLFHGAAVGNANGGVLILGAGGAGKTTTVLACLEAGMTYAGDDRCLLSMDESPFVHSIYGTAKLSDISRFPALTAVIDTDGMKLGEKALYHLHRLPGSRLHFGFPLRAILLAHIENIERTSISPTSQAKGFLALASSGALHLPAMRKQALRCFDSAARRLPVYDLKLGADIRSAPDAISQLLSELR
jgi:hypothetical protein